MYNYTQEELIQKGYKIKNAKITSTDLSMTDYGVLCLSMGLDGGGWGCVFGGVVIGKGYLGAKNFEGSASGIEYIMRIMDTIGVEEFNSAVGKYVRVATKGWGSSIKIIGNILKDQWFDTESFFEDKEV